jgi:hypothetical protein
MELQLLYQDNEKTTLLFLSEEDALIVIKLSGAVENDSYKAVLRSYTI